MGGSLPRPQSKPGAMPPREGLESPPGAAGGELKSSASARHLPQSLPARAAFESPKDSISSPDVLSCLQVREFPEVQDKPVRLCTLPLAPSVGTGG